MNGASTIFVSDKEAKAKTYSLLLITAWGSSYQKSKNDWAKQYQAAACIHQSLLRDWNSQQTVQETPPTKPD